MASYLPLYITMGVLMVDAVIEVGLVGSMVGFLHDRAGKFFTINGPEGAFNLHGKPKGLLVDQGHTSNGAAGTALILVGVWDFSSSPMTCEELEGYVMPYHLSIIEVLY